MAEQSAGSARARQRVRHLEDVSRTSSTYSAASCRCRSDGICPIAARAMRARRSSTASTRRPRGSTTRTSTMRSCRCRCSSPFAIASRVCCSSASARPTTGRTRGATTWCSHSRACVRPVRRRAVEHPAALPAYRDQTTFIITTDHGRGSGLVEWKEHGVEEKGSENIWIAVLGPGHAAAGRAHADRGGPPGTDRGDRRRAARQGLPAGGAGRRRADRGGAGQKALSPGPARSEPRPACPNENSAVPHHGDARPCCRRRSAHARPLSFQARSLLQT